MLNALSYVMLMFLFSAWTVTVFETRMAGLDWVVLVWVLGNVVGALYRLFHVFYPASSRGASSTVGPQAVTSPVSASPPSVLPSAAPPRLERLKASAKRVYASLTENAWNVVALAFVCPINVNFLFVNLFGSREGGRGEAA